MATVVSKKFPIDLSGRTAVGFSLPLNGKAVFNPTYATSDQIKSNLINFLLTNEGERVFNPNFGANLRVLLFDFEEEVISDLKEIIQSRIREVFPSITIEQIEVNKFPELSNTNPNQIQLSFTYSISSFGVSDSISINLQ
tara:strand:- start:373 stop:792 length:420 start_codon:yes stop_codon:yes gene_type:complete